MKKKNDCGCVYLFTDLITYRRLYVGQTLRDVEKRWAEHIASALDMSGQYRVHDAIRLAYNRDGGLSGIEATVVWRGPIEKLNSKETYYIKKHHTFVGDPKCDGGCNLTSGGDGHGHWSEEVKIKISKAGRGKKRTAETKERCREAALRRPPRSVEARRHMSESQFGREHSDETCIKIGNALRGVPKSEIAKQRMSESAVKRSASPLFRAYMSEILMGRKMSNEARAKMSVAQNRLWATEAHRTMMAKNWHGPEVTDEYRAKVSVGMKRAWANDEIRTKFLEGLKRAGPKIAASNTGKRRTTEQRSRQSEAATKRWRAAGHVPRTEWKRSAEVRQHMSDARRKSWASKSVKERAVIFVKAAATRRDNLLKKAA